MKANGCRRIFPAVFAMEAAAKAGSLELVVATSE